MNDNRESQVIFGDITTSDDVDFYGEEIVKDETEKTAETKKPQKEEPKVEVPTEDFFGNKIETEESNVEETEEEENKAEEIKKVEEKVFSHNKDTDYLKLTKELVARGLFRDFEELEHLENLSKEEYEDILSQQKAADREEVKTEVLSALDEEDKEMLEYKKNGGNMEAYASSFLYKKRADSIDISTDNGKKAAIYEILTREEGYTSERAQRRIAMFEKSMELDEEAEIADTKLKRLAAERHYTVVKQQAEYQQTILRAEEEYKTNIKSSLKDSAVEIKKINTIVKNFTERDDRGFTIIDKAYLNLRNDPTT